MRSFVNAGWRPDNRCRSRSWMAAWVGVIFHALKYSPDVWAGHGWVSRHMASQCRQCELCLWPIVSRCSAWRIGISPSSRFRTERRAEAGGRPGQPWRTREPVTDFSWPGARSLTALVGGSWIRTDSPWEASCTWRPRQQAPARAIPRSRGIRLLDEFGLITIRLEHGQGRWRRSGVFVPRTATCWGRSDFGFSRGTSRRQSTSTPSYNNYVAAWGLHPGHDDGDDRPLGECCHQHAGNGPAGFRSVTGVVVQPRRPERFWQSVRI